MSKLTADKLGLYLACIYAFPDPDRDAAQRVPWRLGVFVEPSAEVAHHAAMAWAHELFPVAQGYKNHQALLNTAPLDFLRQVLPYVVEVEPYVTEEPPPAEDEWQDVIDVDDSAPPM